MNNTIKNILYTVAIVLLLIAVADMILWFRACAQYEVSNLNLVKVNKQGDIVFKEILATKDNSIPFMTATGLVSKKGDMVYFLGERDDKKQLIKVSILN